RRDPRNRTTCRRLRGRTAARVEPDGDEPLRLRREHLADGALLVGGAALLVSAFLPWAARGPGHSLHGHALVDAVVALGNTVPGMSAARLTVLWYLVPACGALAWLS